jgi:hypothetical protein
VVTSDEVAVLLASLATDVLVSLVHLRLVVRNNPLARAADLLARPDIGSVVDLLGRWFDRAEALIDRLAAETPLSPAGDTIQADAMRETIARMRTETAINDQNVDQWQAEDPAEEQAWLARMQLRQGWFASFLEALLGAEVPAHASTKTWTSRLDSRTCSYCARLHGVTIELTESFAGHARAAGWSKVYGGLYGPPLHPSCFPAGTPVAALGVSGASERVFVGDLVGIRVGGRQEFSVTPNHPILTDRGWAPAGLLREGDQVVGDTGHQWELDADQHDHQMPALIEDVADAFLGSRLVAAREVPVSAVDFHGDAREGDVAVVGADRRLLTHILSPLPQPASDDHLDLRHVVESGAVRTSYGLSVFHRLLGATNRSVSRSSERLSLFGAEPLHSEQLGLAYASGLHTVLGQDAADDATTNAVRLRKLLLGLAGSVALQQVVQIRRYPWSGHVFNLQTGDGWYIANGVIVRNCRCRLTFA